MILGPQSEQEHEKSASDARASRPSAIFRTAVSGFSRRFRTIQLSEDAFSGSRKSERPVMQYQLQCELQYANTGLSTLAIRLPVRRHQIESVGSDSVASERTPVR